MAPRMTYIWHGKQARKYVISNFSILRSYVRHLDIAISVPSLFLLIIMTFLVHYVRIQHLGLIFIRYSIIYDGTQDDKYRAW